MPAKYKGGSNRKKMVSASGGGGYNATLVKSSNTTGLGKGAGGNVRTCLGKKYTHTYTSKVKGNSGKVYRESDTY